MSILGKNIKLSIFGQSHSEAIGCSIDGLPAGFEIDFSNLNDFLARRAPGKKLTTQRKEKDTPIVLSGIYNGKTCGAALAAIFSNSDTRSKDYSEFADKPRPAHADYPSHIKFAGFQDIRGGGAYSARLTAPLTFAGGIAKQILESLNIKIYSHILSVGLVQDRKFNLLGENEETISRIYSNEFPFISNDISLKATNLIKELRKKGDSIGGIIECQVENLPVGLGGAIFDGIDAAISFALFSIPAVKGVSFGAGFDVATMTGSQNNDAYQFVNGIINTKTNNAGGIVGGMTTGAPLNVKVAFKPTPSIALAQQTISLTKKENALLTIHGRHDPCVVLRASPIVEATIALTILDAILDAPSTYSKLKNKLNT